MLTFYRQVREQILRVTPPTGREVIVTSIMVVILALIMAFLFFAVDALLILARDGLINLFNYLFPPQPAATLT